MKPEQRSKLYALEEWIEKRLGEAAKALAEIKKRKLYLCTHKTWEQYCRERWGKSARRIHQLLRAAIVNDNLNKSGTTVPKEAQARVIAPLSPEAQNEAWRAANATGVPTAERLKELTGKALASLPPEEQVEQIRKNEQEVRERAAKVVAGGDARGQRVDQIRRLLARVKKLTNGLGPEGEDGLQFLEQFEAWLGTLDL
ncbi:MAG TPA: hypothetical protein VGY58_15625 [Gemmataceae bacterium]|jgi:hypothetical protein|nr:hypothetical protein [Gemmataceae bacterium]